MRLIGLALTGSLIASSALASEPRPIAFDELPPSLQRLHAACAARTDTVQFSTEAYSSAVLFFVSCPWKRTNSWPADLSPRYDVDAPASFPLVVYLARDTNGTDAVPVRFPVIDEKGATVIVTTLPVSAEGLHEEAGPDTPWIEALWKPDARRNVCKVMGSWRITDGKAELHRWRVAPTCDKQGPKYETRFESDMPRLVVR